MIITINGKPGAGKSTVSTLLAKKLHLRHYSIGDFMRELALDRGISLLELSKLAEKDKEIDKILDNRQKKLAKKDNFVIDSRLGFYFIPNSLKIFLECDLDTSAKRIFNQQRQSEKENVTLATTKKNIKKRMDLEKIRYKKYYNLNCYDLKNYDYVIKIDALTPSKIVTKILNFIKNKQKSKPLKKTWH